MLLHLLERFANGLSPFRPVYSFAIAGGLLGGGISATLGLSEALFTSVLVAIWGTLLETTCVMFATDKARRISLVAQYGGLRQQVYPLIFIALYLLMLVLTWWLWRAISHSMEAGLV